MIDESVGFVQKKYQERIDNNSLDYRSLWKWYHEKRELFDAKARYEALEDDEESYEMETEEAQVTFPDEDLLTRWAEIVFAEVIKSNTPLNRLPEPFKLDLRRIDIIRRDASQISTQQCEIAAFTIILRQCKHAAPPSLTEEANLLLRTAYIKSQLPSGPAQRESLALEIVRTAYQIAQYPATTLPDPLHICQVQDMLNEQTRAGQVIASTIRSKLHQILEETVFEEINGSQGIPDLLPSQILDRYYGTTTTANTTNIAGSSVGMIGNGVSPDPILSRTTSSLALAIRSIGQRLAHITLIQWRIWAQMLWFKSHEAIFESEEEFLQWKDEVVCRIQCRYPQYRGGMV